MGAKKRITVAIGIGTVLLLLFTGTALAASKMPKIITITCYPIGSLGTILATAFGDTIEKKTGIRARPTPADADMARLLPIKTGEAQVAIITAATIYVASNGLADFSDKAWGPQKVRLVFAGNRIRHGLAVKANSGIKTWADLKGKRVTIGVGLESVSVPGLLAYGGLTPDDVVVVRAGGYMHGIKTVMAGAADACHACPGSPIMREWEAAPYGLRYLPMDPNDKEAWARLGKVAPFLASPIFADVGALGEGGHKWLAYYPYTLSSYDSVDEEVIYTIVKALVEGRDLYKEVKKPYSAEWTLEMTLDLSKPIHIPFHPGVVKYAKERGKWTAEHEAFQAKAFKAEAEKIKTWKPKK